MPHQLRAQLEAACANTDQLFGLLRPEAIYDRPIPERHRLIFYLGHLEAFDWNLVCRGALGMASFHPTFDRLFAFGIDPPEGAAAQDSASDWPSVNEVAAYGRSVRSEMDRRLGEAPEQLLHVAIEHRWMHAETLAYLLHNLPLDRKAAPEAQPVAASPPPRQRMIEIPAGKATLGREPGDGFGWDNEHRQHTVDVPAFRVARHKVTNGEYLAFVRDGADPPHFWLRRGGQWLLRTIFDEVPLPMDWPVYVTLSGACSYARWSGKRLPTEAEFHRSAYGTPLGEERLFPWGDAPPDRTLGNFDFARWDPEPVSSCPAGDSAFGVSQLVGNGWEWTSSLFGPFPGFEPFPFYAGYSANFFDGEHYVIKGASPRTAAPLMRRSFRNWFRPNYPYVYAGFRVVEN